MIATIHTAPSASITDGALRLFRAGYAARITFTGGEEGVLDYSIPSETMPGTVYTLSWNTWQQTLACSCSADLHGRACKHQRLFQLLRGWAVEEAGR